MIRSYHGAFKMLAKAKNQNFNIILKNTPKLARAIKSLFKSILSKKGPFAGQDMKKLKKHKAFIRKVAHGPRTIATVQKGGSVFQTILDFVVPLLTALL